MKCNNDHLDIFERLYNVGLGLAKRLELDNVSLVLVDFGLETREVNPEALQDLVKEGYIKIRNIRKDKPGTPPHSYSLTNEGVEYVLKLFEEEQIKHNENYAPSFH